MSSVYIDVHSYIDFVYSSSETVLLYSVRASCSL